MPHSWSDLSIAIVGGDEREAEIARLAAATGARVRTFEVRLPEGTISGVTEEGTLTSAMEGCHLAIFPAPHLTDGCLFAPLASAPIRPDENALSSMQARGRIVLGTADDALRAIAARRAITLHEYEKNMAFKFLRTPAVIEGALAAIIQATPYTIHESRIAVLGYGMLGSMLARALAALGARVHVLARNAIQRAQARATGYEVGTLEDFTTLAPELDMIVSSIPGHVLAKSELQLVRKHVAVFDLASPPGSIDLAAAKTLGLRAVWARGLGRRAPITVARKQWAVIEDVINDYLNVRT